MPQSVLGPVLYMLFINDLSRTAGSTTATFAIFCFLVTGDFTEEATAKLQRAVYKVA